MAVSLTKQHKLLTFSEFLEGEKQSDTRHEFVNGYISAMAGASRKHNIISGNLFALLHGKMPDGCHVYTADMLVRIRFNSDDIGYYPDIMVSCDKEPESDYYETRPVLIAEVLSPSTEGKDCLEKLASYSRIESLVEYLLVSQTERKITRHVFKDGDYVTTVYKPDDFVYLESLDARFSLDVIYQRS